MLIKSLMLIGALITSVPVCAAIMQYAFEGYATYVSSDAEIYPFPENQLGKPLSGFMWLNTGEKMIAESFDANSWTGYVTAPPALITSEFTLGKHTFELTNAYDFDPVYGDETAKEKIRIVNDSNLDEDETLLDILDLSDKEQLNAVRTDGEYYEHKSLSLSIRDDIDSLFSFPNGLTEDMPDLSQEFTWQDMDPENRNQYGFGEFSIDYGTGYEREARAIISFELTEVVATLLPPAAEVSTPASFWLMVAGVFFCWLRFRRFYYRTGLPAMRGTHP